MKLGDVRLSTIVKTCSKLKSCLKCPFLYFCGFLTDTPDCLDLDIDIDETNLFYEG